MPKIKQINFNVRINGAGTLTPTVEPVCYEGISITQGTGGRGTFQATPLRGVFQSAQATPILSKNETVTSVDIIAPNFTTTSLGEGFILIDYPSSNSGLIGVALSITLRPRGPRPCDLPRGTPSE